MFGLFKKTNWRLVATYELTNGFQWGSEENGFTKGKIFYHLFESECGQRRTQIRTTIYDANKHKIEEFATSTEFYHKKIYRWLSGRSDPDIPRYSEIDQEETMHGLRGTITDTF